MYVTQRTPAAAGAAVVGAAMLATTALLPAPTFSAPQLLSPHVVTADIGLTAATGPFELYRQVLEAAGGNLKTLLENSHPGDLVTQVIANQVASVKVLAQGLSATGHGLADALTTQVPQLLKTALTQLAAGDLAGATNALLQVPLAVVLPATDLLPALGEVLIKPLQNVINVVKAFTADPLSTLLAVSGFIAPLISIPAAAAAAVQTVVDSVGSDEPKALAHALINAPAVFLDGVLNGGYGPDLGPLVSPGLPVKAGGLLSSAELVFNDDGSFFVNTGGPAYALQQVLKMVKDAITPPAAPATAAVSTVPSPDAATVTLTTKDVPVKAVSATQPVSTDESSPSQATPAHDSGSSVDESAAPSSTPDTTHEAGDDAPAAQPAADPTESTPTAEVSRPADAPRAGDDKPARSHHLFGGLGKSSKSGKSGKSREAGKVAHAA